MAVCYGCIPSKPGRKSTNSSTLDRNISPAEVPTEEVWTLV